jgi:hypothetical protein
MSFEPSQVLDKLDSTRPQGRLLNFLMCDQSEVQARVCEKYLHIYL